MNVPVLNGEQLYIPFVGAIIEKVDSNKAQILLQTRKKIDDKKYSGCYEIPGGKLRAFEDVYAALRREVKEECGLELISVQGEGERIDINNLEDTSTLIEPFCVTQMQEGPFVGLIFICYATGIPLSLTNESKDSKWVDVKDVEKMIKDTPQKFYTAFLGPLKRYLSIDRNNSR